MTALPYRRKANYYETDAMGIIYHGNYIHWFEEARVHFMDQLGFGYDKLTRMGVDSPVLAISCEYKDMVRFGDEVEITCTFKKFTGSRMTVGYTITNMATGAVCTVGESNHCFYAGGRPVHLKKAVPQLYKLFLEYITANSEQTH